MTDWGKEAKRAYAELDEYATVRSSELSKLLQPYIETTDRYGTLICRLTLVLGKTQPRSKRKVAQRDLMADVFDFLYEARIFIIKGKPEIAYPLARRAYESLSLMVACYLEPNLAERWMAGKKIGNAEVRKLLSKHPAGESEEMTKELYDFFSQAAHPNRDQVAHRFLGKGNEFALGAIGQPSLAMLADFALKTLNLWFWFGAFIGFVYAPLLVNADPGFKNDYDAAARMAQEVTPWLVEQFNRTLAQEQEEFQNIEDWG